MSDKISNTIREQFINTDLRGLEDIWDYCAVWFHVKDLIATLILTINFDEADPVEVSKVNMGTMSSVLSFGNIAPYIIGFKMSTGYDDMAVETEDENDMEHSISFDINLDILDNLIKEKS